MSTNASMNQDGDVVCFTPAWGLSQAATVTRVLLLETIPGGGGESAHTRVVESMFNYSFYAVFANVSYTSSFGARGGDLLSLSMIGADSREKYGAIFTDEKGNELRSNNCSSSGLSEMRCETPAWGSFFKAATTRFTFALGSGDATVPAVYANRQKDYRYAPLVLPSSTMPFHKLLLYFGYHLGQVYIFRGADWCSHLPRRVHWRGCRIGWRGLRVICVWAQSKLKLCVQVLCGRRGGMYSTFPRLG